MNCTLSLRHPYKFVNVFWFTCSAEIEKIISYSETVLQLCPLVVFPVFLEMLLRVKQQLLQIVSQFFPLVVFLSFLEGIH